MGNYTMDWEPSQNGRDGHKTLEIKHEGGKKIEMAQIHPSNSQNPAMGMTLVKRDMNYGLGARFIPQGDKQKEWNLTLEGAKDRGEHFAKQQIQAAQQLTGEHSQSQELVGQGTNHNHAPESAQPDQGHDR